MLTLEKILFYIFCCQKAPKNMMEMKIIWPEFTGSVPYLSFWAMSSVPQKSLTIPFVPLTNVNTSLFQGQWATVWSFFSPLGFHFWMERSCVSEQPHLFAASFFLYGWVMQSKHSPFCPTTLAASPIIAYHGAKTWPAKNQRRAIIAQWARGCVAGEWV